VQRARDEKSSPLFERAGLASALLPLLFALFAAAVPAYGTRYNTLFGFLLLISAGLAWIARRRGPDWLIGGAAAACLLTFAVWSAVSYSAAHAWPLVLAWIAAFVILFLVAGATSPSPAIHTAGLLFFMFPLLAAIEKATAAPFALFGTMFVLLAAVAFVAVWWRRGVVYFIAATFAIVAEGIWSAEHLDAPHLLSGLAIYGAFALLFLGVPALARRAGRPLLPAGGVAVTVILSLATLIFLTFHEVAPGALWGLALLLSILVAGALVEARTACRPLLAGIAIVMGWILLASWWEAAPLAAALIPALAAVTFFGVLVLIGTGWLSRTEVGFDATSYLALAGHFFLMFVAAQTTLSIPPAPMLAVLGVLTLAVGVTSLTMRAPKLQFAGIVASQVVLMIWSAVATAGSWPAVALGATLALAALGIVWWAIARKRFPSLTNGYAWAAVAGLYSAHIVGIIASLNAGTPMFAILLATHAAIVIATLLLAASTETYGLAILSTAAAALAIGSARTTTPLHEFVFAGVFYVIFIVYPLALGTRIRRAIEPHLAAVIASGCFFWFARDAMTRGGHGDIIGVLPVGEAVVLVVLLIALLRTEDGGERLLSRLALVAAAALGFITLAIPLQLEKQWITIGWALEGAALIWLYRRIPHRGLVAWSAALLAAVFVRLAANRAVLSYHPMSSHAIVNWYFYSYAVCATSFFVAAALVPAGERIFRRAAASCGTALLFLLVNIEIADYYSKGSTLTFNFFSSSLGQDLTYTISWAIFALAMLAAGLVLRAKAVRIAAIVLLLVTVLKCFLHDLSRLGGLYRVGSLLGLAVSLILVGILLQKFVLSKAIDAVPEEAAP
jgi:hypothetical protein